MAQAKKCVIVPLALTLAACWCLSTAFVGPATRPTTSQGQVSSVRDASSVSMRGGGGQYTGFVPDMQRRTLMNLVCVIATGIPALTVLGGWLFSLYPGGSGGGGAGVVAGDINGTPITLDGWLKEYKPGQRGLVQGLKGDPTWVIVDPDGGKIKTFAINAVCTHLGCTVPWQASANKYVCPCHGSQYDTNGMVIRGPAPLSLALTNTAVNGAGQVVISDWKETDFRDGAAPWWA